MKNVRILAAVLAACATLPAFAHEGEHGQAVTNTTKAVTGKFLSLKLSGLHCEGCAMGVRNKLLQIPGVSAATVSAKTQSATVTLAKGAKRPVDATLKAAVKSAGYTCTAIR